MLKWFGETLSHTADLNKYFGVETRRFLVGIHCHNAKTSDQSGQRFGGGGAGMLVHFFFGPSNLVAIRLRFAP